MIDIKVKCRNCGTFTRIENDDLKRIYEQGRATEKIKTLNEFANWLKEKGIHGSKEFTRIIQMYEDELKE